MADRAVADPARGAASDAASDATSDTAMADGEGCVLCQYTGGSNAAVNGIASFVGDNIEKMKMAEMCAQIQQVLAEANVAVTAHDVRVHVQEHISEKRVVLHSIMHDLRGLLRTTIRHSVLVDEETQVASIDHKACALYLDTVKQVVSLYRAA